jgi:hypothetical protein
MNVKQGRAATYGVTQMNLVFRYGAAPGKEENLGLLIVTPCDHRAGGLHPPHQGGPETHSILT